MLYGLDGSFIHGLQQQELTIGEPMFVFKHLDNSGLADGAHCLAEVNA